jgi:hypothetical protein
MSGISINSLTFASPATQSGASDAVGIAVLRKALEAERVQAASMLQALQSSASLATEGSLGTRINTHA